MAANKIAELKSAAEHLKKEIAKKKEEVYDCTFNECVSKSNVHELNKVIFKCKRTLKGHLAKIYAMQWSTDSCHLVSASQDGKLIVWDAYTTNKIFAIPLSSSWVMTTAYSPSGNLVACGGLDNICTIYSLTSTGPTAKSYQVLQSHAAYLSCCRFISDKEIVTSSGDLTCGLWDVSTGTLKRQFTGHTLDVMSIALCGRDNPAQFISGACDQTVKLWDLRTGSCVQTFAEHESDINAVAMFPSDKAFGTGSDDATCGLFDIRADRKLCSFQQEDVVCGITSVDFSLSGRLLFGGYDNNTCNVFDVLKGTRVARLSEHANRVSCLGVSRDGVALCTGSWDANLKVWV
ncbi:guanine nucleotide-binding protein G(I)/G(S)/G(T) subunit beta-3-like isoform X2 [Zophobas morio]